MNFFLGTADSWAGLGWIKNSWLFSWVLDDWASMTIVLYIGLGALIDFCTIVKYPFPSPIRSTLTVLETQVSHQRSSGGRMDDDTSHTHPKSLKLYIKSCFGRCVFVFYFCGIFCFLCPPQNTGSMISDKNFTRIILCKSFLGWHAWALVCILTPQWHAVYFRLETKSQTQQKWAQEEILAGHVCELAHRTLKTGEVGTCWYHKEWIEYDRII